MAKEKDTETLTRIEQDALDKIVVLHEAFRQGRTKGVRAKLAHHDLSKLSLRGHDMSYADFTGSVMYEVDMEKAKLDYCQFYACDLRKANFRNSSLLRADLRGACLRGAIMAGADLTGADMREGAFATYDPEKGLSFISDGEAWADGSGGVDMRGANLGSAKMSGAIAINSNFEDANLSKSTIIRGNLNGANLKGANLSGADLSQCELRNVNLSGANLVGTLMDYSNLVNVNMTGTLTDKAAGHTTDKLPMPLEEMIKLHQLWLSSKGAEGQKLDLSGFDLRTSSHMIGSNLTMLTANDAIWYGLDLTQVNLQAAQLTGSDFRNCIFASADLRGSVFSKCNMVGAKLVKARIDPLVLEGNRRLKTKFSEANMRYADFSNSFLRDVDFTGADLSFANFEGSDVTGANFTDANLHETILKKPE